jgi:hypothetical protein
MSAVTHVVGSSPYLLVEDVAKRLHCSTRTVHELTRTSSIPHRRLPGSTEPTQEEITEATGAARAGTSTLTASSCTNWCFIPLPLSRPGYADA